MTNTARSPRVRSEAKRAYSFLKKKGKRAVSQVWLKELQLRNRYSSQPVVGETDVVVSLTSYGRRISTVAYAVESIAAGWSRPRELILWLDDAESYQHLPASLKRLQERGLEIRLTENYGPHTKYFPYVNAASDNQGPLATADDDVLYPPSWLKHLYEAWQQHPDIVNCYRAAKIASSGARLAPYGTWRMVKDTTLALDHFATGVSGVIYPEKMIKELAERGTAFLERCPSADDVWLHWVALQASVPVRQIARMPVHFPVIPGTQIDTLVEENVRHGANDKWISGLYSTEDVARLAAGRC